MNLVQLSRQRKRRARSRFMRARVAETHFNSMLQQVARQVGAIVRGFTLRKDKVPEPAPIVSALDRYSELLDPWARAVAQYMIADVNRRDELAWREHSDELGRALRRELRSAPVGAVLRGELDESVKLIKSLPTEAGQRVHKLALRALTTGERAETIVADIMRTGHVTQARAHTIARTEVSRTAEGLKRARAQHVGSEGYTWRSMEDGDVRPSHAAMEGRYVRWDSPPTLDGMTGHAGTFPNCRCYAEPVVPDFDA